MKRHLRKEISYTMMAVFMMNLLLAGGVEETPDGLAIMLILLALDAIIFSILLKDERTGFEPCRSRKHRL